jgi:hypothetical protein
LKRTFPIMIGGDCRRFDGTVVLASESEGDAEQGRTIGPRGGAGQGRLFHWPDGLELEMAINRTPENLFFQLRSGYISALAAPCVPIASCSVDTMFHRTRDRGSRAFAMFYRACIPTRPPEFASSQSNQSFRGPPHPSSATTYRTELKSQAKRDQAVSRI